MCPYESRAAEVAMLISCGFTTNGCSKTGENPQTCASSVLTRREFLAGATAAALQRGGAGVLVDNSKGRYRFVRGIAPYSSGAVAMPGYEVVHATLDPAPPYRRGFERVDAHLRTAGRPPQALCGIELRSPRPFTFQGFIDFNREYVENLR